MAHHQHHDDDTYFLDQLCMVALSGAFGVICLCLYFVNDRMLYRLLAPQFHPFVLGSGITLILIAVVRAGIFWSMAGAKSQAALDDACCGEPSDDHTHSHSHAVAAPDHGHSHSHSHGARDDGAHNHDECGHDHAHSHGHSHADAAPTPGHSHGHGDEGLDPAHAQGIIAASRAFGHTPSPPAPSPSHGDAPNHTHSHAHSHADSHGHSHGNGDHEHAWAPWRYVVLLVPIVLFMLGLPSRGPTFDGEGIEIDSTAYVQEEALHYFGLVGLGHDPKAPLGPMFAKLTADLLAENVNQEKFKRLEEAAGDPADREYYKGRMIGVRGQYLPKSERSFDLARFKIQCCQGDAIPLRIPVIARDNISGHKDHGWVDVTARVDFRPDGQGKLRTVLVVGSRNHVYSCPPDVNPYAD